MEAVFGFRHRRLSGREEGEEGGECMSHSSLTILKDLLRIVGEDEGLEIRGESEKKICDEGEERDINDRSNKDTPRKGCLTLLQLPKLTPVLQCLMLFDLFFFSFFFRTSLNTHRWRWFKQLYYTTSKLLFGEKTFQPQTLVSLLHASAMQCYTKMLCLGKQ